MSPKGPLMTISVDDDKGNAFAYVVIDSIVNDTSSGGVRIVEDLSLDEIKILAREMTLKYSFIGLPRGGTKSGIKLPITATGVERKRVLHDFGRRIARLMQAGIYYPGMDMNCTPEDLRQIYHGAGLSIGSVTNTSFFTGLSVASSVRACVELDGVRDKVYSVAIEGFGNVGRYLAEQLPEDRFSIVAVSTVKGAVCNDTGLSVEELIRAKDKHGDDFVNHFHGGRPIERYELFSQEVDALVPCARTHSIRQDNIQGMKARFIVPASNAPYAEGVTGTLYAKGITCLPGFVCNSGGVFGSSLSDSGVKLRDIVSVCNGPFRSVVEQLVETSRTESLSPVDLACEVAKFRFENQTRQRGKMRRVEKLLARGCQNGLVFRDLYARFVLHRFRENLRNLSQGIESLHRATRRRAI